MEEDENEMMLKEHPRPLRSRTALSTHDAKLPAARIQHIKDEGRGTVATEPAPAICPEAGAHAVPGRQRCKRWQGRQHSSSSSHQAVPLLDPALPPKTFLAFCLAFNLDKETKSHGQNMLLGP